MPPRDAELVRANRRFVGLAKNAILHSDPGRFALLYRLLWRLQANPRIMEDKADADVRRVEELDKSVRRDSHKMHAFVRFRLVEDQDAQAGEHYVAWFEPEHHILRANAGFFMRRFANMRWSILTPRGSLHWDGETMREGPPAQRGDAPEGDPIGRSVAQLLCIDLQPRAFEGRGDAEGNAPQILEEHARSGAHPRADRRGADARGKHGRGRRNRIRRAARIACRRSSGRSMRAAAARSGCSTTGR